MSEHIHIKHKRFYGFLYLHHDLIAKILAMVIALLTFVVLMVSTVFAAVYFSLGDLSVSSLQYLCFVGTIFVWIYVRAIISDWLSDYSYLKIYKDEKYYHSIWLKTLR